MNRFQLDESDDFLGPSDAKRHRGFVDVTQGQLTKDSSSHVTPLEWLASVAERINQTMHYQVRFRQCFPKTGPRTFYGPPKFLIWSMKFSFRSKTCNTSLNVVFNKQIWSEMVRSIVLWSARKSHVLSVSLLCNDLTNHCRPFVR